MAPRGSLADGPATRQALVDASLEQFARYGVGAVSIRSINTAAGLGAAAVHYHFRTKAALIEAVVESEGSAVVADIIERIEDWEASADPPGARALVDVLAGAYLDLLEREPVRGRYWLLVVGQLLASEHPSLATLMRPVDRRFGRLVRSAFPGATEQQVGAVLPIASDTLVRHLARAEPPRATARRREGTAVERSALLEFVAGGMARSLAPAAVGSRPAKRNRRSTA